MCRLYKSSQIQADNRIIGMIAITCSGHKILKKELCVMFPNSLQPIENCMYLIILVKTNFLLWLNTLVCSVQ